MALGFKCLSSCSHEVGSQFLVVAILSTTAIGVRASLLTNEQLKLGKSVEIPLTNTVAWEKVGCYA